MSDELEQALLALLRACPEGIAEHALLKQLQAEQGEAFPDTLFQDQLALFRAHFLLFHALYRLRDRLLGDASGLLEIDARCIRLKPYAESAGAALADHDPMRDFYLDLAHLQDTTADDVEQLLGAFWVRYYAGSRRDEALAVLGLDGSADLDAAQRRYRELAMQHHPDRGGDATRFHAIQEAIAILRRC
jgi:DnaJ-domain-containing protein 1